MIDVVIDVSCIYGLREEVEGAAFDSQSSSLIKLNNGTILYLREVNKFLALVCILREDNFDRQGVIDYNFLCFRNAIQQVFELRSKALAAATSNNASVINVTNHPASPASANLPDPCANNIAASLTQSLMTSQPTASSSSTGAIAPNGSVVLAQS
ncbi:hypothetical protein QAD02_019577 [Eretmocerus hayati]|nr:hypothetical protein QAD02_019577 [Eretmocerus hayati]